MRALVVEALAADYAGCAIREAPTPEPGPGEVRVRVRAAGVNFPDLLQTRGEYQHKPDLPFIPGLEVSGEVEALGEGVTGLKIGDPVAGSAQIGGISDYAVSTAGTWWPKPADFSWGEAAGFGSGYITAYVAFVRRADLRPGEWVLVLGAAGGMGLAAVDLARQMGARVIAAASSDAKLAVVQAKYAPDAVVNVTGGFRDRVMEITGGHGCDVIFDPVGGDVFDEAVRCVAFDGRLCVVGFTSGRRPILGANIALIKGFSLVGVRAGEYGRRFPEKGLENRAAIWKLAHEGKLRPHVYREYPLTDWRAAFDALADRQVIGKSIIRLDT